MKADNNKYVIGVDVGTQSAKVSIFDLSGNVVSYAAVTTKIEYQLLYLRNILKMIFGNLQKLR